MMETAEGSIPDHVNRCLHLFRRLSSPSEANKSSTTAKGLSFSRAVGDQQTRFKIWAGNIGAHKTGMSSLEYRLRDSSNIRQQVVESLKDLESNLCDAVEILEGVTQPWDHVEDSTDPDEGDDPETELDQISLDITDIIVGLLRLSVAIRNPAPHDRFLHAHSTDTSYYEQYDIQHVLSKFHSMDKQLAENVGKAISRRRQYFKYRKSHNAKLCQGLEGQAADAAHTIASSLPEHLKQSDRQSGPKAMATLQEDDGSVAGFSQTSYATTAVNEGQRRIPPLPQEASKGPFECPFCYMIIIATDRASWKCVTPIFLTLIE